MCAGLVPLDAEAADLSHQTTASTAAQTGAGSEQAIVDVAVQTSLHMMKQAPAEHTSTSAADQSQLCSVSSPVPESNEQQLAFSVCETVPEPQGSHRLRSRDAGCGPESHDLPHDAAPAADVVHSSVSFEGQPAHSMGSSGGHRSGSRSKSVTAHMEKRPGTADSHHSGAQTQRDSEAALPPHRESVSIKAEQQNKGAAEAPAEQYKGGQSLVQKARAKGHAKWSKGLQLPDKLSIASLAKHAGVDRAFMQV